MAAKPVNIFATLVPEERSRREAPTTTVQTVKNSRSRSERPHEPFTHRANYMDRWRSGAWHPRHEGGDRDTPAGPIHLSAEIKADAVTDEQFEEQSLKVEVRRLRGENVALTHEREQYKQALAEAARIGDELGRQVNQVGTTQREQELETLLHLSRSRVDGLMENGRLLLGMAIDLRAELGRLKHDRKRYLDMLNRHRHRLGEKPLPGPRSNDVRFNFRIFERVFSWTVN